MYHFILISTLLVLANGWMSDDAAPGTFRETTGCYASNAGTSLHEPEPAMRSWFADSRKDNCALEIIRKAAPFAKIELESTCSFEEVTKKIVDEGTLVKSLNLEK